MSTQAAINPESASNHQPFIDEVLALHRFLDDWLKARTPHGNGEPARLAQALADDFEIIHPDGSRGDRASSVAAFARAYGEKPPAYALEIDRVKTRVFGTDLCLATYVERHRGEPDRARIATALLRRRADGAIEWLFLQETPAPHLDT